jgi:gamma-glutamyltranspeptidase/glutathione hydrolase
MFRPVLIVSVILANLGLPGQVVAQAEQASERPRPSRTPSDLDLHWHAEGRQGAVVAGGAEAVQAGMTVLRDGGNATDAAVATLLALAVTDAHQFCLGGEVPLLIYEADRGVVEVIAGQGAAPRLATLEAFEERGGIPGSGIEAATVPAALDACLTALERQGTKRFQEVVAPTLAILDRGEHAWHNDLARTLRSLIAAEGQADDRRQGLRLVADYFYRGPIAKEIDAWSRSQGGLIRYRDLATHVTRVEEPVLAEYRGLTIVKCGPWTQGPALLQALQILQGYDLEALGHNQPKTIHTVVESLKLALADRDEYYADPLFEEVPLEELLSKNYAQQRRALIDPRRASQERRPGNPKAGKALLENPFALPDESDKGSANDTTTCIVADRWGNVVAATPSGWSGVLAGETGIWLGSRLQSFNTWPGHPNAIEPGKRPRITLTPTLVLEEGKPAFAVSVAGGDGQDQVTLQLLLNLIDFRLSPAEAVTAPRFVTEHYISSFRQRPPELGQLRINADVGEEVIEALKRLGHEVREARSPLWHPSVLRIDPTSGQIEVAGDPKANRHASAD